MRRTMIRFVLMLFLALALSACQTIGDMIWSVLPTPDMSAYTLPVGTPVVGISGIPTARPPVPPYTELTVGHLAIMVRRVVRPADSAVGKNLYTQPGSDEEYLSVEVQVRCLPGGDGDSCRITEFDFGVSGKSGQDYAPQFSTSLDGVEGLFEGGKIEPGHSLHGNVIFIIHKGDKDLILTYPRMYNFGQGAQFRLGQ